MTEQDRRVRTAEIQTELARLRVLLEPLSYAVTGDEARAAACARTKLDEMVMWLRAYERGGIP